MTMLESPWASARDGIEVGRYGYDVSVLSPDGRVLHVPVSQLVYEEQASEVSASVTCRLPDVMTTEGPMAELVMPGTPFFLSLTDRGGSGAPHILTSSASLGPAWDPMHETGRGTPGGFVGPPVAELLRGPVLKIARSSDGISLDVTVRDTLRTLLKDDVDVHFDAGTTAAQALGSLFSQWGVQLGDISWPDVELPTFTARGQSAAKVVDDILAEGPKRGVGMYTLRMRGEVLDVILPGGNAQVYWLRDGAGAGISSYSIDISNLVGSVRVKGLGGGWDEGRERSLEGDTEFNGAQRVIVENTDITEQMADLQAQATLAESGFPELSFEHETFDVPLVRKWDRIRISDRVLDGYFIVTSVSHSPQSYRMRLGLITPEDLARKAQLLSLQAQLAELKQEQQSVTSLQGRSGSALDVLRKIASPVMGRPYVYSGALGRSVFDANPAAGVSTDCSGFVSWMYSQLGHANLPAQTMSIYGQIGKSLQQVGTSVDNAVVGDIILFNTVDPGNPTQPYGHVGIYAGGNRVLESGGNAGGIGEAAMLSTPYLVLRSPTVYQGLYGGAGGRAFSQGGQAWPRSLA